MIFKSLILKVTGGSQRTVTVKKNAIAAVGIKGVSLVISLLLVPLTLGYVSSELYGLWLTLSSMMVWLNFFDIGFTLGLKNKLAEAIANDEWSKGKSLVSTCYILMVIIFIPLLILLEIMIPNLNWSMLLNVSQAYNDQITLTLQIIAVCFCLQMIVQVLNAVVAAFQKTALSSSFAILGQAISLVAIWFFTKTIPASLPILALVLSLSPIFVTIIATFWLFTHNFKKVAPSFANINWSYINDLFSLGYKFFVLQIKVVFYYQLTNFLLLRVATPDDVTQYNISYKYFSIATMFVSMLVTPIWPAFTDAYTKGDFEWMRVTYKRLTQIWVLSMGLLVLMFAFSAFFYHIWVGDSVSITWSMNIVVAVYVALISWAQIQLMMINGIGKIQLQMVVAIVGCILFIPVTYGLGYLWGAVGVVIGLIAINIIDAIIMTTQIKLILSRKALGIWSK